MAEAVVGAGQGGEVPPEVNRHLKKSLKEARSRPALLEDVTPERR
ncbi:hypothetical protein ABTY00_38325 [Streptomyces microflavus]